jgi:hypothetical protein
VKARILKLQVKADDGHMIVSLADAGKKKTYHVHSLVLTAFVGPKPDGMECCHRNGDHEDNTVGNLRWDTKSENMLDRVRHGTHPNTNKTHCKYGHEFTSENTHRYRGMRHCLACRKRKSEAKQAKLHASRTPEQREAALKHTRKDFRKAEQ